LKDLGTLELGHYHPIGDTDSELAFCYLLGRLATAGIDLQQEQGWLWLYDVLKEVNRHGPLNCLLSDGQSLFCYHDATGYKGLSWRPIHEYSLEASYLEDEELQIELESPSRSEGFAVATHPLTGSGWRPFRPGELIVFGAGKVRCAVAEASSPERAAP
jgi:predicted glutamine amidotransferase